MKRELGFTCLEIGDDCFGILSRKSKDGFVGALLESQPVGIE